jgi:hypothetical protein
MGTKDKIGALIILGGVALIGVYWFKKNKPTLASKQAKGLEALSNFYKTGGTDETLIKGYTPPEIQQISLAQVDYSKLTPKELEDLKKAIGTIPDPSASISNQISQNMQNADFSNLSNLGIAGVTFNIAPKK